MKLNNKGFSPVILLVVMVLIGLLTMIVYKSHIQNTKVVIEEQKDLNINSNITTMQTDIKVLSDIVTQYEIVNDGQLPVVTNSAGETVKTTIVDDIATVDLYDAINQAYKASTGSDLDADSLASLDIGQIDLTKLTGYPHTTYNSISDYFIVTNGPIAGEVFYKERLVGDDGNHCNSLYTDITE